MTERDNAIADAVEKIEDLAHDCYLGANDPCELGFEIKDVVVDLVNKLEQQRRRRKCSICHRLRKIVAQRNSMVLCRQHKDSAPEDIHFWPPSGGQVGAPRLGRRGTIFGELQ